MLNQMLAERNIPPLKDRAQMLAILQEQVYGFLPPAPEKTVFENTGPIINDLAGKARCEKIIAHCRVNGLPYSFPFYATIPEDGKKHPFFVHINFRPEVFDRYMPTEELVDNGYAVLSFGYEDVTPDNDSFRKGLPRVLMADGKRKPSDPGKIALWAWAAHRLMDYAHTIPEELDVTRGIVCGHSRLGKAALLAGATDTRFAMVYSNNSGCSGAALSRKKNGESIDRICRHYGYWFCENYWQYGGREAEMPFDQHYLLASIAPRPVCVGSATLDAHADPISEQLCCLAAAPAFGGDFCCDRPAQEGEAFFDGRIGYHLRRGTHYFSRTDWLRLMEFAAKHL